MKFIRVLAFAACLLLPVSALAAGAHEDLNCVECHSIHDAKDKIIFAVPGNSVDKNPRTNLPFSGVTALCLGCHQTAEKGGQDILPIQAHISHPYGLESVNPKVARVPDKLLRDGRFECVSCHDPHPSNTNYKYLRVDTDGGSNMQAFCAVCHPRKADPSVTANPPEIFDSMDESK